MEQKDSKEELKTSADDIEKKYFKQNMDNWELLGLREAVVKQLKYVMQFKKPSEI